MPRATEDIAAGVGRLANRAVTGDWADVSDLDHPEPGGAQDFINELDRRGQRLTEGVPLGTQIAGSLLLPGGVETEAERPFPAAAAVRNRAGEIATGRSHFDALQNADRTIESMPLAEAEEGFVDRHGNWMSRDEANTAFAKENGFPASPWGATTEDLTLGLDPRSHYTMRHEAQLGAMNDARREQGLPEFSRAEFRLRFMPKPLSPADAQHLGIADRAPNPDVQDIASRYRSAAGLPEIAPQIGRAHV